MDRIWNGWRARYVSEAGEREAAPEGSVFTQILNSGMTDVEAHIVHRGQHLFYATGKVRGGG